METDNEPRTEDAGNGGKQRDKRGLFILLLLALVALLAGVLVWFILQRGAVTGDEEAPGAPDSDFFDPMAESGLLPDMTEAELQAELDRVVEDGMLNVAIAGELNVVAATGRARADIVNSAANHYIFKVSITLNETGETVYESGGIAPGQYIQYIQLDPVPPTGEHPATALFTGYTVEDRQIAGQVAVGVVLYVP